MVFDADNDGDLDILASNFTDEEYTRVLKGFEEKEPWDGYYIGTALYVNDGKLVFKTEEKKRGLFPRA